MAHRHPSGRADQGRLRPPRRQAPGPVGPDPLRTGHQAGIAGQSASDARDAPEGARAGQACRDPDGARAGEARGNPETRASEARGDAEGAGAGQGGHGSSGEVEVGEGDPRSGHTGAGGPAEGGFAIARGHGRSDADGRRGPAIDTAGHHRSRAGSADAERVAGPHDPHTARGHTGTVAGHADRAPDTHAGRGRAPDARSDPVDTGPSDATRRDAARRSRPCAAGASGRTTRARSGTHGDGTVRRGPAPTRGGRAVASAGGPPGAAAGSHARAPGGVRGHGRLGGGGLATEGTTVARRS